MEGGEKKSFPTTRPTPSGSNAKHSRTFSPGNWLKILATGCVCLPSNGGTEPAGQADQETEDVPNNKVDGKEESRKKKKNAMMLWCRTRVKGAETRLQKPLMALDELMWAVHHKMARIYFQNLFCFIFVAVFFCFGTLVSMPEMIFLVCFSVRIE